MSTVKRLKLFSLIIAVALFTNVLLPPISSVKAAEEIVFDSTLQDYEFTDSETSVSPASYRSTDQEKHSELTDQRTLTSKTYLLESKRYESVVFAEPVHYLENGEYKAIDNSLVLNTDESGETRYINRANSFTASFASSLASDAIARLTKGGCSLSWSIEGFNRDVSATAASALSKSAWSSQSQSEQRRSVPNLTTRVNYSKVLADADLELILTGDRVKENIILYSYQDLGTIRQQLTVEGLELILQKDQSILAVKGDEIVFLLPSPYAVDASDDSISPIDVTLVETTKDPAGNGRTYDLIYTLDRVWLEKAQFPVKIDPTVLTSLNHSDIKDALISENFPNVNYGLNAKLNTGNGSESGINYSLIRFPVLPTIGTASMVQYAGLKLTKKTTSSGTSNVSVHEVTSTWDSMSVTWASKPTFEATVDDYQAVSSSAGVEHEWDITRIAKKWYTGGNNYGILLKDMSDTGYKQEYYSSDSGSIVPYAYFVYCNYSGLEGYWDYSGTGLGRSGNANVNVNVNLYNGNLVYTHTDVAMTGNRLPISVTHVFNSTTKDDNDSKMLYGKGWRTNYDQRVSSVTISGISYYQYIDEDGTIHYFKNVAGVWKDESGLDLTLTIVSNVVTITDKNSNYLVFHTLTDAGKPGFLNYIQDRNDNRQTVGYDANSRISQITDAAGRIVKYNRDASGNLYQIGEPTGSATWRYTTFAYTSSRLTSITYPDGEVTSFSYDANGNISTVSRNIEFSDGSGTNKTSLSKLNLTYTSLAPYRVTYLGETSTVSGVTTDGAHAHYSYGYNRTTLEDSEGRSAIYQFNDLGNTVCVVGPDGGAAYAGFGTEPTSGDMSKATTVSRFQKFSANYLKNHNMEFDSAWSLFSGTGSTGTHVYATDQKYQGARSVKLDKTNTTAYESAMQTLNLVKGNTYTLSGYIKTSGISDSSRGASFQVSYYNSSGSTTAVFSSFVEGTTDWTRYNVTFTVPSDATSNLVYIYAIIHYSTGTAWFDCLQLEDGPAANRYNLVDNADFTHVTSNLPNYWTTSGLTGNDIVLTAADSTNPVTNDDNRMRIYGAPASNKYIVQNLSQSGAAGDTYVAGAWAKAASVALRNVTGRAFSVDVFFDYTNSSYTDEWLPLSFSEDSQTWQYVSSAVVAKYEYSGMAIRLQYQNNANSAEFDAVQLFREDFGSTYAYDGSGNLTKVTDARRSNSSGVNRLGNGSAELAAGWEFYSYSGSTGTHDYSSDQQVMGERSIRLVKTNTTYNETARQYLNLEKGKTYTYSGYIKTSNVSSSARGVYIAAVYYNVAGAQETVRSAYLTGTNNWNRYNLSFSIPANATSTVVYLYCLIYYSTGTAWFDCLQLEEGSAASDFASDEQISLFKFNTNHDLTQYIDTSGKTFAYSYDTKHNLMTATSAEGIVYTFTYDTYGNQTSAKVGDTTNYIKSSVTYNSGNYTDIVTDPFGKTVNYNYDSYKGTLGSVVDPLGNTVNNTYNANTDALLSTYQTSGGVTMTNTYTYLDDRLINVAHNSTSGTVGYDFEANGLGWTTGVQVTGTSNNLVTYSLQAKTGRLNALTYGNGDVMNYSYDGFDQLKTVSEGSTALYKYEYDDSGNVGYLNDLVQNKQYWYEYDSLDRLGKITSKDASGNLNWSQYTFNTANALSGVCQDSCRKSSSKDFGLLSHTSLLRIHGLVCLRQRSGFFNRASA